METITAALEAAANGCKLALTLFLARNTPAMQGNAAAATTAKIHDLAAQHIASQNTAAVQTDLAQ